MKSCPKCKYKFENSVGFCPRDGEVLQEDASAGMVGQVLDGQYEIEEFIAQGGMARSTARATFCSATASW